MKSHPKIAVALPDSKPWGITRFFNGVNEYAHEHGWLLTSCPVNPGKRRGFPARMVALEILESGRNYICRPMIPSKPNSFTNGASRWSTSGRTSGPTAEFPGVAQNNPQVGRLAAEHLLSLGLKNLAYHGVQGRWYSAERMQGFKQAAKEARIKVNSFCLPHMTRDALWNERYEPIKRWLKTLPLPAGVFAVHDYRALIVLSACREAGPARAGRRGGDRLGQRFDGLRVFHAHTHQRVRQCLSDGL